MEKVIEILKTSSISSLFVLSLLWFLKNSIQSWIFKEHSREIEAFKASLSNTAEFLKFELQKDAARANLFSNNIYSIYPELFQKARIAHGIVDGIYGFRYVNSWDGFVRSDFEKVLADRNIPSGKRDDILAAIESNRSNGLKALDELLWGLEFSDAHKALFEFKNYTLLKEVFISTEIKLMALEIHKELISAKVDAEISRRDLQRDYFKSMKASIDKSGQIIDHLANKIHMELNPTRS
jgi:hypothetical protein